MEKRPGSPAGPAKKFETTPRFGRGELSEAPVDPPRGPPPTVPFFCEVGFAAARGFWFGSPGPNVFYFFLPEWAPPPLLFPLDIESFFFCGKRPPPGKPFPRKSQPEIAPRPPFKPSLCKDKISWVPPLFFFSRGSLKERTRGVVRVFPSDGEKALATPPGPRGKFFCSPALSGFAGGKLWQNSGESREKNPRRRKKFWGRTPDLKWGVGMGGPGKCPRFFFFFFSPRDKPPALGTWFAGTMVL